MPDQRCPNCQTQHDVSIFVTGQRVRCSKCGIRFEVQRDDASFVSGSSPKPPSSPDSDPVAPPSVPPPSRQASADEQGPGSSPQAGSSSIAEDATAISQGISIPGFEVLHVLGRGGMGDVYLARQDSLNRQVAVKVLAAHLAKDPDFVVRFEKEATALATLSHPNVVSIIDRGSHGGILYFVMEYVDGHSLRDLIRKGPMEPDDAIKVVTQVCNAIDYAHGKGVIHRDLKPENILIDVHGRVKVADFGLAGIIDGDERIHITRTDVAMGTFNYMAPEQRRNAREVDARADLFSLGVVLYELLTGEVPIGRFRLPSQVLAGLDPKVDHIVERALQTNPGERYQRASAIHDDLSSLLGSSRLTVAPAPARTFGEGSAGGSAGADRGGGSNSGISELARSADSVVDRAGRSLFKLARLGAALAALAVLTVVIVGSVKLIGWIWDGENVADVERIAKDLREEPEPSKNGGGDARPRGRRPQSPLVMPVRHKVDDLDGGHARREIDFADDTAGTTEWYHYRGWWEHREGQLVHDVFMAGEGIADDAVISRIFVGGERYFFEGFRIEARITLDRRPPVTGPRRGELLAALREASDGMAPQVSVYLYRNMRHFLELRVRIADDGGYEVLWNLDDEERAGSFEAASSAEPAGGSTMNLAMWVTGGRLHVAIDGRPAGSANLGELTDENWGKAGFGCHFAVCTVEEVTVEGRTRPPPSID